jgi:hypothetical protein
MFYGHGRRHRRPYSFRYEDWPHFIGELIRDLRLAVRRFVSPIATRRLIVIARRELRFNALRHACCGR